MPLVLVATYELSVFVSGLFLGQVIRSHDVMEQFVSFLFDFSDYIIT
jgi:hypothetical protein